MDKTEKLIDWKENERNDPLADPKITGGDPDANWANAQFSGDESAVSSSPTPDQNVVEEIGQAIGVTYADDEVLKVGEKEEGRDEHRWELDPASSEDYVERVRDEGGLDRDRRERR